MCGLVGWISSEKGADAYDRRKFIDQALILDTVRGGDSTGVFVVEHGFKADETPWANWQKICAGGHELVISPEYKKLFEAGKLNDYKYVVGHNRSATVGGVVIDAAHPFTEGPITLVHNGTVKKEYTNEVELANDSHGICWRLSKDPVEEVIKDLDGAFALIWHDARDDSLNFVRNAQRPLHMAKAKGHDTIYFASEAEMLYWLDKRLTLKLQDIVSMKPAHWLKFKAPKLMVPEVKPVELYSPKAVSQPAWEQSNWSGTTSTAAGVTKIPAKNLTQRWMDSTRKSHAPGRKNFEKIVPEHLQNELCEYNLFVEQEEEFIPMMKQEISWHGNGKEYTSIMGWLMPQDRTWNPLPCILHGVSPHVWNTSKERVWTINPLGMTRLGWEMPTVIGRLKGTYDIGGKLYIIPEKHRPPEITANTKIVVRSVDLKTETKPAPKLPPDFDDPLPQTGEPEYPGPRNRMLSTSEWYAATQSGCRSCGNPFSIKHDAWSVTWVDTDMGTRPMCASCVDIQSHEGDDEIVKQGDC